MPSAINPANPIEGAATTASVRENFLAAKNEIEALQAERAAMYTDANATWAGAGTPFIWAGAVDPQGIYNNTNGRVTANRIGWMRITAQIFLGAGDNTRFTIIIRKNGTPLKMGFGLGNTAGGGSTAQITISAPVIIGDYFDVTSDYGITAGYNGDQSFTYLNAEMQ